MSVLIGHAPNQNGCKEVDSEHLFSPNLRFWLRIDSIVFQCAQKFCLSGAHYHKRHRQGCLTRSPVHAANTSFHFPCIIGALEEHQFTYDAEEGRGESSSERATSRRVSGINQSYRNHMQTGWALLSCPWPGDLIHYNAERRDSVPQAVAWGGDKRTLGNQCLIYVEKLVCRCI